MKEITLENINAELNRLNYKQIETAHIIGLRLPRKDNVCTDHFDDFICVIIEDTLYGPWPATTLPGLYYLKNPMNHHDTCFIYPGQYINCFQKGIYKDYAAIRQIKGIKYFTDANRDNIFDMDESRTQVAMRYTHIHKAGPNSKLVHTWSAACQVFANAKDFSDFMAILEKRGDGEKHDKYTYTLLNWN